MKKLLLALLILTVPFSIFGASQSTDWPISLAKNLTESLQKKSPVENPPVTIIMTGDIMLGRYIATLRAKKGADFPFTYMPDIIKAAQTALGVEKIDLIAGNLEGPIVEDQLSYGDMVFRFDPEVAALLKKVGFTTLQTANNHTYNQKKAGLNETQDWLKQAGLDSFGLPDEPTGFISYEIKGQKIGFLGLDDVDYKLDPTQFEAKIKELDQQVDFLIVGVHWGIEYKTTASDHQIELAHLFIDSGADFIWGTHPHVVENSEVYNGKTIYYSLGNFVFDQYWSAATQKGLVLAVKITKGEAEVKEIPVNLVNEGEPQPAN